MQNASSKFPVTCFALILGIGAKHRVLTVEVATTLEEFHQLLFQLTKHGI